MRSFTIIYNIPIGQNIQKVPRRDFLQNSWEYSPIEQNSILETSTYGLNGRAHAYVGLNNKVNYKNKS